jgi:endogenous inhibitor of DNA gyrase (YacG/DUF329 family)
MVTVRSGYVRVNCACCSATFEARIADRNRGWGKYCSKRCKAIKQEQRTGQYARYLHGVNDDIDYEGQGWDAHKDVGF